MEAGGEVSRWIDYYGVVSSAWKGVGSPVAKGTEVMEGRRLGGQGSNRLKRLMEDLGSHRRDRVLEALRELIDLCSDAVASTDEGRGEEEDSEKLRKRRGLQNRRLRKLREEGIDDLLEIVNVSQGGDEKVQTLARTLFGILIGMDEEDEASGSKSSGGSGPLVKRFVAGEEISIREQSFKEADLGWKVWSSCDVFLDLLESCSGLLEDIQGKDLLELGCGTGLLGIACAKLGARSVLMTDYHESVVNNARRNAESNKVSESVTASVLDWYEVASRASKDSDSIERREQQYEVIIASDVIYTPQVPYVFPSVIRTLLKPSLDSIFYVVLPDASFREGIPEFEEVMTRDGFSMTKTSILDRHSGVPHGFYSFRYSTLAPQQ